MRALTRLSSALLSSLVLFLGTSPAIGGVHLWRVKEIFSNADGTIQFIEIATCCGSTGEFNLAGHVLKSNSHSFTFPSNVSGTTLNKHVLLATNAFRAMPGAPTPDHIIADNFFSTTADTITFSFYDTLIFPAGRLPTNGASSLNKDPNDATDTTFIARNSPKNFADQTGIISAVSGPPGVPDGARGTTMPVRVAPLDPDASSLRIFFDVLSCTNIADHHILYGQRSGLPGTPGGTFTLLGSVCGIGATSPYDWVGVPRATDAPGLIWALLVATDSSGVEGSWGVDSRGNERVGPGNGGASGICSLVKDTNNTCGSTSP